MQLLLRLLLSLIFLGVMSAAALWWFIMPQGFPVDHVRFWMNTALPIIAVISALIGLFGAVIGRYTAFKLVWVLYTFNAIAVGAAGKWLFPISISDLLVAISIVVALAAFFIMWLVFQIFSFPPTSKWRVGLMAIIGLLIGLFIPWSQRAPQPMTQPLDVPLAESITPLDGTLPNPVELNPQTAIFPKTEVIRLEQNQADLLIYPMLTFISRSPDRFWPIIAPGTTKTGPDRLLIGAAVEQNRAQFEYQDDFRSQLVVSTAQNGGLEIEAYSTLPQAVYSHHNRFLQLKIRGLENPALSFSTPNVENQATIIELKPYDYPTGRPARVAYLDQQQQLRVVEASTGEKGPFYALAESIHPPDQPLVMTIFDGAVPQWRVILYDWAAQASSQLSTTAGWRLPENAIEFSLLTEGARPEGVVFFSLAGASVGRGWDSVGHAAGTYRNRLTIEPVRPNP